MALQSPATTTTTSQPHARHSIAVSQPKPGVITQHGDDAFMGTLNQLYDSAESRALEQVVNLKKQLKNLSDEEALDVISAGLAKIAGCEYVAISKRILFDVENGAVEMPPIGEPGSCLMALSWYQNDMHGHVVHARNVTYHAFSCPCAYMRHDKVFLIPERLNDFIPSNPNNLPFPGEAYLGLPLFVEGKCVAHFAIMYGHEGLAQRELGWGFIEMLCHSLEDVILQHLVGSPSFQKGLRPRRPSLPQVIPHDAVSATQSLKPYARSLSHELRTPMQGVIGMLDLMYATVQEAAEQSLDIKERAIFQSLRDDIEMVQDSSRRAVEAADNVVQAYDLNMGFPELDHPLPASPLTPAPGTIGLKRRGSSIAEEPAKRQAAQAMRRNSLVSAVHNIETEDSRHIQLPNLMPHSSSHGIQHCNIRDLLEVVIMESLKIGGRPVSVNRLTTERGQIIDVLTKAGNGVPQRKTIEWSVEVAVPETIWVDERDLAKLVSCVFQNALKFTEEGAIVLNVSMDPDLTTILINVVDSGCGIPPSFLPKIFHAFAREDDSITRYREGLGLGLLVARGLARKLRGDLALVRSSTAGPTHGSEFEIRIPVTPFDSSAPFNGTGFSTSAQSTPSDTPPTVPFAPTTISSTTIFTNLDIPSAALPLALALTTNTEAPSTPPLPALPSMAAPKSKRFAASTSFNKNLAASCPLTFLVAEDNIINRKLLVSMLGKLGYDPKTQIYEAHDGADAVKQVVKSLQAVSAGHGFGENGNVDLDHPARKPIDVVLMDLWMPCMDGYEATERILAMFHTPPANALQINTGHTSPTTHANGVTPPTILAVTADATDGVAERAAKVGMTGFMVKPFKLKDLERLIREGWDRRANATAPQ